MLRNFVYRTGRKLYQWARGETQNSPVMNGEYSLLMDVLSSAKGSIIALDVGANRGEWSRKAVSIARSNELVISIHAFEPLESTRTILQGTVHEIPEIKIEFHALSNVDGTAPFFSETAGAGTSSLHPVSGAKAEDVSTITLDTWFADRGYSHITMIKIDVEGFDSLVLEGGSETLAKGMIDVVQFEYNWRWLVNARSLYWVFQFIQDKPYVFGKLIKDGIISFDRWHFELDRFFEGNYVLLHKDCDAARKAKPAWFDDSNVLCIG